MGVILNSGDRRRSSSYGQGMEARIVIRSNVGYENRFVWDGYGSTVTRLEGRRLDIEAQSTQASGFDNRASKRDSTMPNFHLITFF